MVALRGAGRMARFLAPTFAVACLIFACLFSGNASAQTACAGRADEGTASTSGVYGTSAPACLPYGGSGTEYDNAATNSYPANYRFITYLPDSNPRPPTANPVKILFLPTGGATRSTITAVACSGGTITGVGTTLVTITLAPGTSCPLTVISPNGAGGALVSYAATLSLDNPATTYALSAGTLTGDIYGGTVVPLTTVQAVATTTLTVGTAATAFTPVTASGGVGTLSYAVAPTLPAGLLLNTSTGQITGTPTAASAATTYTVTVTDQASQTSSKTFSLTVNAATTATTATSTTLTSSLNPSLLSQPVVLTARVAPAASTGTVTFSDGGTVLCNIVPVVAGAATCSTSFASAGAHSLSAVFTPTGAYTASTGTLTQTVIDQRAKTVAAIGTFLATRNNQILTNGPDGQRQIDRLVEAGGGPAGGPSGTGFASSGGAGASASGLGLGLGLTSSRLGDGPDGTDISRLRAGGGGARPIGEAIAANAAGSGLGASANLGGPGCESAASFSASQGGPIAGIAALFGHNGAGQGGIGDPCAAGASGGGSFGGTTGGMRLNGTFDGATRLGFATSLRDMTRAAADADARKLTDAGLGFSGGGSFGRPARANPFDIWVEAKYAGFADNRANADLTGHFGVVSIGADYVLSRSLLVGTMVQFDSLQQRSGSRATDVRGHGWLAGPYATLRLSPNVFWQVRGAWGQSSNTVSPFLTYTDSFDSTRWLVSSTLAGRWRSGAWSFRPSASISYMEDVSRSYADTFGLVIPSVKSSLGQAKAGPEVSYRLDLGHTVIEPHAGVQVIYNFANETSAAGFGQVGGEATGPAGTRGRVELGVRALTSGGIGLDVSGGYDGIGTGSYSAVTGKAMVRVPLN